MSENVTSKFRVDVSDLKKNIAEATRQIRQYRAEMQNANAGMKKGEETADSLSRKIDAQTKIVEAEKAKLQALKEELARYEDKVRSGENTVADLTRKHEEAAKAFGEDSEEARKLARQLADAQAAQERNVKAADELRTKIIQQDTAVKNAKGQVRNFSDQLNDLQKEEKETGDEAEKTTKGGLNSFAVALGNLASQVITKAVQGLGNLVKSVVETGKAFDSSMSNVKAISGATAEDMEKLSAKAEEMGATTKFTATEAADAMSYMAMAGWKTEEMLGGIDGIMNLAAASGAELATTSDIVTDSLTAFGKSAKSAGRLADIMAAASSNSNTNVEMMGETFKYAAPLAGAMGYSMEDVAVATGLMANAGIKATQAGTSLRSVLTRMSTQPKEAAAAMEQLGVSLDDGHGNMKSLMQVMEELRGSFGTLKMSQADFTAQMNKLDAALESGEMDENEFDEAQEELITRAYGAEGALKAQYAAMLAGKNGLSGFLAIVNSSEEDFDSLTESIYDSKGAAEEMARIMNDNLEGSLTLLSSAFDGFKKKIYDSFSAPLNDLVKQITANIMPALTGIVEGMPGAEDKLADGISNLFSNALKDADKLLPRAVDALGAVLGALGDAIVRQAPAAVGFVTRLVEKLVEALAEAAPDVVSGIGVAIRTVINGLTGFLPNLIDSVLMAIPEVCNALLEAAPQVIKATLTLAERVAKKIPEAITKLTEYLPLLVQGVSDFLVTQTPVIVQSAIDIVTGLVQALPTVIQALVDALPRIFKTLTGFFSDYAPMILQACLDLVSMLVESAPDLAKAIYPMIPQIMDTLVESVMNFIPVWIETLSTMFDMVASAIPGLWESVKESFAEVFDLWKTNIFDRAVDAFVELWGIIKDKLSPFTKFVSGIYDEAVKNTEEAIGKVVGFFSGMWDKCKKTFTDLGTKIGDAVSTAFKAAVNGALDFIEERLNAIPNAINGAIDVLNAIPGVDISPMDTITLPRLAQGGIAEKPMLAQIGEAGREAIIPLEKNKAGLKEIARLLHEEMQGAAAAPVNNIQNNGKTTTINYTQNVTSPKALSHYEVWRQNRNMMELVKLQLQGV